MTAQICIPVSCFGGTPTVQTRITINVDSELLVKDCRSCNLRCSAVQDRKARRALCRKEDGLKSMSRCVVTEVEAARAVFGCSVTPRKWNDVCAGDSNRPPTVGGWARPTSGSRASGANLYRAADSSGARHQFRRSFRVSACPSRSSKPKIWPRIAGIGQCHI